MSDSDDYDDWMLDDGAEYYYLEDAYAPADDLAEHTCPSPVGYDSNDDWDEHSRFTSYWNDLKYNSDSYMSEREQDKAGKIVQRRGDHGKQSDVKRKAAETADTPSKKRRFHSDSRSGSPLPILDVPPPVMWVSHSKRQSAPKQMDAQESKQSIAVMKNWRSTAHDNPAFGKRRSGARRVEVRDEGYEGEDEQPRIPSIAKTRPDTRSLTNNHIKPQQPIIIHPEIEEEEADEVEDKGDAAPTLDPEALKRALREHLTAAGININGLDENTLLEFATRMFAAGDEADGVVGELTEDLLGDEDEEKTEADQDEPGFASWVSKQVSGSKRTRKDSKENSQDGEVGGDVAASEPWPPPVSSALRGPADNISRAKRKAEDVDSTDCGREKPRAKRQASSYLAPTAASAARNVSKGRLKKI